MSTFMWGAAWDPSTRTFAPWSWAISATAFMGTVHPVTLLHWHMLTSLTFPSIASLKDSMSKSPSGPECDILISMPAESLRVSHGT